MKIFLIRPVRGATEEETQHINYYVATLEELGYSVHWPARDTDQNDSCGLRICQDNRAALMAADEVHIYWSPTSKGSLFDLGMAFAANKPLHLANSVTPTAGKSFENMIAAWEACTE